MGGGGEVYARHKMFGHSQLHASHSQVMIIISLLCIEGRCNPFFQKIAFPPSQFPGGVCKSTSTVKVRTLYSWGQSIVSVCKRALIFFIQDLYQFALKKGALSGCRQIILFMADDHSVVALQINVHCYPCCKCSARASR